jgi:two-component system CheB/CheR fusion protein
LSKLSKKQSLDITECKHAQQELQNLTRILEHQGKQLCSLALELTIAEQRERQRLSLVLHDDLQQLLAYLSTQIAS